MILALAAAVKSIKSAAVQIRLWLDGKRGHPVYLGLSLLIITIKTEKNYGLQRGIGLHT